MNVLQICFINNNLLLYNMPPIVAIFLKQENEQKFMLFWILAILPLKAFKYLYCEAGRFKIFG